MRACGGLCTGAENGVKKMKIVLQNLTKTFPGRGRKDRNDVTAVDDLSCYTGVYYLLFVGLLTLLFRYLERRLSYFR